MTLYEDLGAAPTATRAELRRAFVDAARRSHPDALPGADRATAAAAAARMRRVNDAWAVLGDPQRRARYDAELAQASRTDPGRADRRTANAPPGARPSQSQAGAAPPRDWRSYSSPGAGTRSARARAMALAPAALGTAAVVFLGLGYLLRASVIVSLAVFCASAGAFAFLAAPLVAMKEARAAARGARSNGRGLGRHRRPTSSPHRRQG